LIVCKNKISDTYNIVIIGIRLMKLKRKFGEKKTKINCVFFLRARVTLYRHTHTHKQSYLLGGFAIFAIKKNGWLVGGLVSDEIRL